jgi:WD40 repeat protein
MIRRDQRNTMSYRAPKDKRRGGELNIAVMGFGGLLIAGVVVLIVGLVIQKTTPPSPTPTPTQTPTETPQVFSGGPAVTATTRACTVITNITAGRTIGIDTGTIAALQVSAQGERVAVVTQDQVTLSDGINPPFKLAIPSTDLPIGAAAFSADGGQIVVGSANAIRVYDALTNGRAVGIGVTGINERENLHALAWSADSRWLAAIGGTGALHLWNTGTGAPMGGAVTGYTSGITAIRFSPDGSKLAAASQDGSVKILDSNSGRLLLSVPVGGTVKAIAWNPAGTQIAASNAVWDTVTGTQLFHVAIADTRGSVAWSPDGLKIAFTVAPSVDTDAGITIVDANAGTLLYTIKQSELKLVDPTVLWSTEGGRLVAIGGENILKSWEGFPVCAG